MSKEKLLKWEDIYKPATLAYTIHEISGNKKVKCRACNGKGYIKQNGNEFQCMNCFGNGTEFIAVDRKWIVSNAPRIITKIDIEQSKKENMYKVLYWFGCNGYRPENTFLTKNKATKECNKRNLKIQELEQ